MREMGASHPQHLVRVFFFFFYSTNTHFWIHCFTSDWLSHSHLIIRWETIRKTLLSHMSFLFIFGFLSIVWFFRFSVMWVVVNESERMRIMWLLFVYGGVVVSDPRVFGVVLLLTFCFSFSSFRILWTKMFHVYVCVYVYEDGWRCCVVKMCLCLSFPTPLLEPLSQHDVV
jgi:hypothetical protein